LARLALSFCLFLKESLDITLFYCYIELQVLMSRMVQSFSSKYGPARVDSSVYKRYDMNHTLLHHDKTHSSTSDFRNPTCLQECLSSIHSIHDLLAFGNISINLQYEVPCVPFVDSATAWNSYVNSRVRLVLEEKPVAQAILCVCNCCELS
jgi:hypothetical protein